MDLDEAVARTLALLERQGYATYRTLKRRWHLDDATLAALTTALLATQPLVAEEGGTRLVWRGPLRPATGPTRLDDEDAPPVPGVPRPTPGRRAWTPLVGRAAEVALLQARWAPVLAGQGQVVLLGGDAGLGKSRLVEVVTAQAAAQPHQCWECRCDPALQHSPLAPVIALLQRGLSLEPSAPPAQQLQQLDAALAPFALPRADVVPLLAQLLALPPEAGYTLPPLAPAQQKQQTLVAIGTLLAAVAAQTPVLCVVEDLHWADASTLELLTLLVARVAGLRCYLLLTHRPEFQAPWAAPAHSTTLTLQRLGPAEVTALVTQVAGSTALPAAVVAQISARTEGVPLFVEEVTQMVLAAGAAGPPAAERAEAAPPLALPATVHASVAARVASLGAAAQRAAQGAAVWGRAVTEAQLQATVGLEGPRRDRALGRLVAAAILQELSQPPRVTYVFKHALLQEVLYATLPDALRRALHGQVAQYLVAREPETVARQPERVAQHYTAAGDAARAVPYWQRAGQRAVQGSAHAEAVAHLTQGLTVLMTLPETPARVQQELDFQVTLGPALFATQGQAAPEVERAYARARDLCAQVGDTPQLFPVLRGLLVYYQQRGQLQTATQLGEQLLRLAQAQPDPALLLLAHCMLGTVLFWRGEPAAARTHHTQALARYDPQAHRALAVRYGVDLGVTSASFLAWALWSLGFPAKALQHSQAARILAQEVAHPWSLALALVWAATVHQHRREVPAAQAQAAAVMTLATAQGFASFLARGMVLHGWALALQGQGEAGIAAIRQGLAADLDTGSTQFQPYFLGLLAEAYGVGGRPDEGLAALAEALAVMDTTELRYYAAELSRLQGVLLLQRAVPDAAQAEACFQQALAIARQQQARSWELRAATSLARLWQAQGKRQAAHALLAPVYAWFTEGFDTADLQEAKGLLDALA